MPPDVSDADRSPNGGAADPVGVRVAGTAARRATALALAGTKTTTAGLLAEYEVDEEPIAKPGEWSILVDSEERPVALIETISCRVERLADVDDTHAIDEGEGYADAAAFRGGPREVLERLHRRPADAARRPVVHAHR